jgi:hypothetical protein
VTILPGFTDLARRAVGARVALRAYRAWLACGTELAIVAGGSRSTGKTWIGITSAVKRNEGKATLTWLAGQPGATSRSTLALNAWGTGNASAAVRSRLTCQQVSQRRKETGCLRKKDTHHRDQGCPSFRLCRECQQDREVRRCPGRRPRQEGRGHL